MPGRGGGPGEVFAESGGRNTEPQRLAWGAVLGASWAVVERRKAGERKALREATEMNDFGLLGRRDAGARWGVPARFLQIRGAKNNQ